MVQVGRGLRRQRWADSPPAYGSSVPRHLSLDQLLAAQSHPAGEILTLSAAPPTLPPAQPRGLTDLLSGGRCTGLLARVARAGLMHVPRQWVFAIRHLQGAVALIGH